MKLAEALTLRKSLQEQIKDGQEALEVAATSEVGTTPDEDPKTLEDRLDRTHLELETLVVRIHRTNLTAALEADLSITAAVARRDTLVARHRFTRDLLDKVLRRNKREMWDREGGRQEANIKVKDLRATVGRLGQEIRLLDSRLQQANWAVDLQD